ncbi:MAG: hypothetical protein AAF581_18280 [Planctomycetota bacterium]
MENDVIAMAALHTCSTNNECLDLMRRFESETLNPIGLCSAESVFPGGFNGYISAGDRGLARPSSQQMKHIEDWLALAPEVAEFLLEGPMSWADLRARANVDYPQDSLPGFRPSKHSRK